MATVGVKGLILLFHFWLPHVCRCPSNRIMNSTTVMQMSHIKTVSNSVLCHFYKIWDDCVLCVVSVCHCLSLSLCLPVSVCLLSVCPPLTLTSFFLLSSWSMSSRFIWLVQLWQTDVLYWVVIVWPNRLHLLLGLCLFVMSGQL